MDSISKGLFPGIIIATCCILLAACMTRNSLDVGAAETPDTSPPIHSEISQTQEETIPLTPTPGPVEMEPIYVRVETAEEMESWAETADASGLYNHNVILAISGDIDPIPWTCIEDCDAVREVVLEEGGNLHEDFDFAFKFDKITLPSTFHVEYLHGGITRVPEIEISPENPYYKMVDGVLYDAKMQIVYYANRNITEVHLPDTVREIDIVAFAGCSLLTHVDLPDSVTCISAFAFDSCRALTEINLPDSLLKIWDGAFWRTPSLKRIRLPAGTDYLSMEEQDSVFWAPLFRHECGLQSIVCEGTNLKLDESFWYFCAVPEQITQLVFLSGQPEVVDGEYITGAFPNATVYYLSKNQTRWAPNGETEWKGCQLVAIDSLDDLPPLN